MCILLSKMYTLQYRQIIIVQYSIYILHEKFHVSLIEQRDGRKIYSLQHTNILFNSNSLLHH